MAAATTAYGWEYPEHTQALPYEEGMGTKELPYIITTAQQLADLAYYVNTSTTPNDDNYEGAYFKLGNDIDLNPGIVFDPDNAESYKDAQAWTPIGSKNKFKGHFDGDNHTIKGLYLKGDNINKVYDSSYIVEGLFGEMENGTLSNLTISNSLITFSFKKADYITITSAFFAAETKNCNFYNLKNEGNVRISCDADNNLAQAQIRVSGIVGTATESSSAEGNMVFEGCENHGSMKLISDEHDTFTFSSDLGFSGIVGYASDTQLTDCHNYGNLDGNGLLSCGGIGISVNSFGSQSGLVFSNLSNSGDINGGAGLFQIGCASALNDSYNTGNITNGCGLINDCQFDTLSGCYNSGDVNDMKGRGVNGTGGLIGYSDYLSAMENCYNTGKICSSQETGGLIGCDASLNPITVKNCYNKGDVESSNGRAAGGLIGACIGYSSQITFENCYNTATVKGGEGCGGLAGTAGMDSFTACYNEGNVIGSSKVGGIAGTLGASDYATLKNCYNVGSVSGSDYVAGLCPYITGTAQYCYNYGDIECESQNKALLFYYNNMAEDITVATSCYSLPRDGWSLTKGMSSGLTKDCATKTESEFNNGTVCVLLNADQNPTPWGQEPGVDPYPLLNGKGNPDISAINEISANETEAIDHVYTVDSRVISVRDVKELPSGIYIVNGRKVAVR